MASSVKTNLGLAVRMLLKPLVRLMISQGITFGDFAEATKDVYVEMALRYFCEGKLNKSKVAILTGLTRKEVANVIARAASSESPTREFSRPGRVLFGWHTDPAYTGPYGMPIDIPYDAPDRSGHPPSFVHLVKTYSGDMPPKGVLEELVRVGCIAKVPDSQLLRVVRRDFEPEGLSSKLIERFGDVGFNFISTVSKNVEKKKEHGRRPGSFDSVVASDRKLTRAELEEFDEYLRPYLQGVLETIDNWFASNVTDKDEVSTDEPIYDTGVAMVQYVDWRPEDKTSLRDLLIEWNVDVSETENDSSDTKGKTPTSQ